MALQGHGPITLLDLVLVTFDTTSNFSIRLKSAAFFSLVLPSRFTDEFLFQSSKVLEEFCIFMTTFPNSAGVERLRRQRGLFSTYFLFLFQLVSPTRIIIPISAATSEYYYQTFHPMPSLAFNLLRAVGLTDFHEP